MQTSGEKNFFGFKADELVKPICLTAEVDGKTYLAVTGMLLTGEERSIEELASIVKATS